MQFVVTPPSDPNISSYAFDSEKQTLQITLKDGTAEQKEEVSTGVFCAFATSTDLLTAFREITPNA